MLKWKCVHCGPQKARYMTNVLVSAPFEQWGNLGKSAIASKDVTLYGADWSNAVIICCKCGTAYEHGKPVGGEPAESAATE